MLVLNHIVYATAEISQNEFILKYEELYVEIGKIIRPFFFFNNNMFTLH